MTGVVNTEMSKVAEKLRDIEGEIASEKGAFTLFALIERDDTWGRWDVVVSARWIDNDDKSVIETIAFKIRKKLSREEQIILSRILVLPPSDSFVKNLSLSYVEHGIVRLSNTSFNGISVKRHNGSKASAILN